MKLFINTEDANSTNDSLKNMSSFLEIYGHVGIALVSLSPFREWHGPSFELYLRILCAKFYWNWPSGSGNHDENKKNLQADGVGP